MGRTKRKRKRKQNQYGRTNLCRDENIVNLLKWMKNQNWSNETNLRLGRFQLTGRGVYSLQNIRANEVLINIPSDCLITYHTFISSEYKVFIAGAKLRIHDLLATFLVLEKHKGDQSFWKQYMDSLPSEPPDLPWTHDVTKLSFLPPDLLELVYKCRDSYQDSWRRVEQSINAFWRCNCCDKDVDCVLTENVYRWGYILVNSRAIYVDPQLVRQVYHYPDGDFLSDEPAMALCPFLDMFNHDHDVTTEAALRLIEGKWCYQLRNSKRSEKNEEVFISYGPHDNSKLLMEYGFFVPGNKLDKVGFTMKETLEVLKISLNRRQYRFITDHGLDRDFYVWISGVSFSLKAFLYVSENVCVKNWGEMVFGDFDKIRINSGFLRTLILHAKERTEACINKYYEVCSENINVLVEYLNYRIVLLQKLCDCIEIEFT